MSDDRIKALEDIARRAALLLKRIHEPGIDGNIFCCEPWETELRFALGRAGFDCDYTEATKQAMRDSLKAKGLIK